MTQECTDGDDLVLTHDFLSIMLGVKRPCVTVVTHVIEGTDSNRARRGGIVVRDRDMLKAIVDDAYQIVEDEYERVRTRPAP